MFDKLKNQISSFELQILLLLLLIGFSQLLQAQETPAAGPNAKSDQMLQFNIVPISPFVRSGAPIPAELIFTMKGREIISGKLELEFRDGRAVLSKYLTDELTVSSGFQRKRIMLPPMSQSTDMSEVRGKFIVDKKAVDLGSVPIILPSNMTRNICIGYVRPENSTQPTTIEMAKQLQPENFIPDLEKFKPGKKNDFDFNNRQNSSSEEERKLGDILANDRSGVKSGISGISNNLFPITPEACCAYDILILQEEGFSYLNKKQLDALASWILAGGVACIYPGKALCQPIHLDFFKRVESCSETESISPELDKDSHMVFSGKFGNVMRIRAGLGRVAVLKNKFSNENDFTSREWRVLAAFLWRVRDCRVEYFLKNGKFFDLEEKYKNISGYNYNYSGRITPETCTYSSDEYDYSSYSSSYQNEILAGGKGGIQFIPLWVIVLILASFAIITGPLDYYVLGKLKMRRLTWIVFPVVCVMFAVFTKLYSDYKVGLNDRKKTLTIFDIGADGSLLWQEKYYMVFPGKTKTVRSKYKDEILASRHGEDYFDDTRRMAGSYAPSYEGSLYNDYSCLDNLKQWVPHTSKTISFHPHDEDAAKLKFPEDISNINTYKMTELAADAFGKRSDALHVMLMKKGRVEANFSSPHASDSEGDRRIARIFEEILNGNYGRRYGQTVQELSKMKFPVMTASAPRISMRQGLDLAPYIDELDQGQSMAVVIVFMKDNIKIYRRAYGL